MHPSKISPYAQPFSFVDQRSIAHRRPKAGDEQQTRNCDKSVLQEPHTSLEEILHVIKHIYQAKFIFGDSLEGLDENFNQDMAGDLHSEPIPVISSHPRDDLSTEQLKIAESIIRKLYARSMELTQENKNLNLELFRIKGCEVADWQGDDKPISMRNVRTHHDAQDVFLHCRDKTDEVVGFSCNSERAWSSAANTSSRKLDSRAGANSAPPDQSLPNQVEPPNTSQCEQFIFEGRYDAGQLCEDNFLSDVVGSSSLLDLKGQILMEELRERRRREKLLRSQLEAHLHHSRELDVVVASGEMGSLAGRDQEKLLVAREMLRDLTDSSYLVQQEISKLRQQLATRDELARCRYRRDLTRMHKRVLCTPKVIDPWLFLYSRREGEHVGKTLVENDCEKDTETVGLARSYRVSFACGKFQGG